MTIRFIIWVFFLYPTLLMGKTLTAHCRDYPPDLFFKDGTCVGIVPDLVSDIMTELGYEIEWMNVPWIRTIAWAKQGKVDLVVRHSMTPERTQYLHAVAYSDTQRTVSFYQSPELDMDVQSYDDLNQLKVGIIRGMFYSPHIARLDAGNKVQVSNTEQLIRMLQLGRIDLVATTQSHNEHLFKNSFKKAPFSDTFTNPMFVSFSKKSRYAFLYKELEETLILYKASGRINDYFSRYSASELPGGGIDDPE